MGWLGTLSHDEFDVVAETFDCVGAEVSRPSEIEQVVKRIERLPAIYASPCLLI